MVADEDIPVGPAREQDPPTIERLLRALPRERLIALVAEQFSGEALGARIRALRGSAHSPDDPVAALRRLTHDQLIELLRQSGITRQRAEREFAEYRFTRRPSLYLRAMSEDVDRARLAPDALRPALEAAFADLNARLLRDDPDPPSCRFAVEHALPPDGEGLVEVAYRVEHRVDLVDPSTRAPETRYTLALGAAWIHPAERLGLIQTGRRADADAVAAALATALGIGRLDTVTLTDALLAQVVDEEAILSGAFARAATGSGPRAIRYSDSELGNSHPYTALRADAGYRPTAAYYRQHVPGLGRAGPIGVGFTRHTGHIWIPYPLAKRDLIDWAKRLMRTIAGRQAHFLASDISAAVATRQAAVDAALPATWRSATRDATRALLAALAECLQQGLDTFPIATLGPDPIALSLARQLGGHWLAIELTGECDSCHDESPYPCPHCGGSRFVSAPSDGAVSCARCRNPLDLSAVLESPCRNCGSIRTFEAANDLELLPGERLLAQVGQLLPIVAPSLGIGQDAWLVEGRMLRLLRDRRAPEILRLEDIAEFGQPAQFDFYDPHIQRAVLTRLGGEAGKEKCHLIRAGRRVGEAAFPCPDCAPAPHPDRECLRTIVIDRLRRGRIEPHTGTEVGDLVFHATVRGLQRNVIAFGKGSDGELKAKNAKGRELLEQVWQWHDKADFDVIAVLASVQADQALRLAVQGMARYGGKAVLYLERDEVRRLLAQNIASGTDGRRAAAPTPAPVRVAGIG